MRTAQWSVSARTRAATCLSGGAVLGTFTWIAAPWQVALVTGWDLAAAGWLVWTVAEVVGCDGAATKKMATQADDSRAAADILVLGASLASLVGVLLVLLKASESSGRPHTLLAAVGAVTVVLSWATVHMLFALRYARLYYDEDGGIDFHDDRDPGYVDFAYVALTLGMTYQVSDTDLTSRIIRRTALRHALLSYLFGTVIIATTINLVAGFLSK